MNSLTDSGINTRIRKAVISLASSAFELIFNLADLTSESVVDDQIKFEKTLENSLLDKSNKIFEDENSKILSIIRGFDTNQDLIQSQISFFKDLHVKYDNFVQDSTSKKITDKDKRYQIATNFFSYIVHSIIHKENECLILSENLKRIRTNLLEFEKGLNQKSSNTNNLEINKIIEFAALFEKTLGILIKELDIDAKEILTELTSNAQI
jgi:hypothetical protein